jgi:RND family efflux transporter MFP subunit
LALLLAGCGGGDSKTVAPVAATTAVAPLELANADVARVTLAPLGQGLPITGSLQALHQTTVQAQVASDVAEVLVREGQTVTAGQLLARLGVQEVEARVKQAEANLASARVDAQLARATAERNKAVYEKHYFSELDYQRSVGDAEAREQAVKSQEAMLAIARKQLDDATVKAPMAGIVAKRYVDPGSSIGMDGKLFDIVDLRELELAAQVPAPQIPKVRVGQDVSFMVDGFGTRQFSGKVARINPLADGATRAISVYISVTNPNQELKGGMFTHGEILTGSPEPALIVPQDAVHNDPGNPPWVLVLADGKLEKREVSLGDADSQSGRIALPKGVSAGETVVVTRLGTGAINRPARLSGN